MARILWAFRGKAADNTTCQTSISYKATTINLHWIFSVIINTADKKVAIIYLNIIVTSYYCINSTSTWLKLYYVSVSILRLNFHLSKELDKHTTPIFFLMSSDKVLVKNGIVLILGWPNNTNSLIQKCWFSHESRMGWIGTKNNCRSI